MNIENMTDEQKSVMLAKLMGWRIHDVGSTLGGLLICISESEKATNLYTPANMALAWRIHCWMNIPGDMDKKFEIFWEYDDWLANCQDDIYSPDFQRLSLDKILTLAIEAGMVGGTS